MEDEVNSSGVEVPMCTPNNWTVFKFKFKNHALNYGLAGRILATGEDNQVEEPKIDDLTNEGTAAEPNMVRKYPANAQGREKFRHDTQKYEKLISHKQKLTSKLISKLDDAVATPLITHPEFERAYARFDILRLWQLLEETVSGKGTVSVYQLALRVLKLKQQRDFITYSKEFADATKELLSQGTAEDLLQKIFNTLFIIGLDQEEFRDKLTPIYGTQDWPNYDVLSNELRTYSESKRHISMLDGSQAIIQAHTTYNTGAGAERGCWNCDSPDHFKTECPKRPNRCKICDGKGHLEKHCLKKGTARRNNRNDLRDRQSKVEQKNQLHNKKPSHKTERRRNILKKSSAFFIKGSENEEEDEDEDSDSKSSQEHSNDSYEDDESLENRVYTITFEHDKCENQQTDSLKVMKTSTSSTSFVIDNACVGGHVLSPECAYMLSNIQSTNTKVHGLTTDHLRSVQKGTLGNLGTAYIVNNAPENLLSLSTILESIGGSYAGNDRELSILDSHGHAVLMANNSGDGFWRISGASLCKTIHCYLSAPDPPITTQAPIFTKPLQHYTAEERKRAEDTIALCKLLGHPGEDMLIKALDQGNLVSTHLTAQDVRNRLVLFGKCTTCLAAKMKANPTPKLSNSQPAVRVGQHLHGDLVELPQPSVGGVHYLLVLVCEKTAYLSVLSLKSKHTSSVLSAMDATIAFYASHGHKVEHLHTDNEAVFHACRTPLGHRGIQTHHMPSGHHECLAERYIQTLKRRRQAILLDLPYVLDPVLNAESYHAAARGMNITPCTRSGFFTPHQLVRGTKPIIPRFSFGQVGLFTTLKSSTAEPGVLLKQTGPRGYRAYLPGREVIISSMKFVPLPIIPPSWNLQAQSQISPPPMNPHQEPDKCELIAQEGDTPTSTSSTNVAETTEKASSTNVVETTETSTSSTNVVETTEKVSTNHVTDDIADNSAREMVSPTLPLNLSDDSEGVAIKGAQGTERTDHSVEAARLIELIPPLTPPPADPPPQLPTLIRPRRSSAVRTYRDGPARFRDRSCRVAINRICNDSHGPLAVIALRLSIKAALRDRSLRQSALEAISTEINNMIDNKVVKPIRRSDIPISYRHYIIPVFMFLKEKFRSDGSFDKMKARLVACGNQEDPEMVGETRAPTVNPISVFTQLKLTATRQHLLSAYDVKGAFLLAKIERGRRIFLRVPPDVVELWVKLHREYAPYANKDGSMLVEIKKYLYGLQESPYQFNSLLNNELVKLGFTNSVMDPCCYKCERKHGIMILSVHVDDLLLTSPTKSDQLWFEQQMQKKFELVHQYDNLSYLGMNIKYDMANRDIIVSQPGFAADIVKRFGYEKLTSFPDRPSVESLTNEVQDSPICTAMDTKKFLSTIMSIMYLARLTRPDLLATVTILATKTSKPTQHDFKQLIRLLKYLAGTINRGIQLDERSGTAPSIYADASHNCHPDSKGHGGFFITLGRSVVLAKSFKLRLTTRSSAESELLTAEEASTYVEWYRLLLSFLGCPVNQHIPIYQDNKSTIIITVLGNSFKSGKHMMVKKYYLREQIQKGFAKLVYLKTSNMCADILTKPVPKDTLLRHLQFLNIVDF